MTINRDARRALEARLYKKFYETRCQWFALCDHKADTKRKHPILGEVPICNRCNDKLDALK